MPFDHRSCFINKFPCSISISGRVGLTVRVCCDSSSTLRHNHHPSFIRVWSLAWHKYNWSLPTIVTNPSRLRSSHGLWRSLITLEARQSACEGSSLNAREGLSTHERWSCRGSIYYDDSTSNIRCVHRLKLGNYKYKKFTYPLYDSQIGYLLV